jgi:hypothetical protein
LTDLRRVIPTIAISEGFMRQARQVVATSTRTQEPPKPERHSLDLVSETPPSPAPLPRPGPADRIAEALRRWLEEEM